MRAPQILNSFRARLVLLLVVLLGLTLGVQYYVNLQSVTRNAHMLVEQEQAIMAGVALGVNSINSRRYLDQMRNDLREPLIDEKTGRVKNVLVVNTDGFIEDSLIEDYSPQINPDKTTRYVRLTDIALPPLTSAVELAEIKQSLPPWLQGSAVAKPGEPGAFYFPVETTKGRWYIIVVLDSANTLTSILQRQTSRSAFYTLMLLLATTLVTGLFVWRFTRPVKQLRAFQRVSLKPGESKVVTLPIGPESLWLIDQNMQRRVEPGDFEILVGTSSNTTLKATLTVK